MQNILETRTVNELKNVLHKLDLVFIWDLGRRQQGERRRNKREFRKSEKEASEVDGSFILTTIGELIAEAIGWMLRDDSNFAHC